MYIKFSRKISFFVIYLFLNLNWIQIQ